MTKDAIVYGLLWALLNKFILIPLLWTHTGGDPKTPGSFPMRNKNSVIEIPDATPKVHTECASWDIILHIIIQELGTRPLVIYTPPGYEQNVNEKYPSFPVAWHYGY